MLLPGARFDARHAHRIGFLQEVVPRGEALARALEVAEAIASYPNFPGNCADRRALLEGLSQDLDDGLLLEARIVRPTVLLRGAARGPRALRRGRARCVAAAACAAGAGAMSPGVRLADDATMVQRILDHIDAGTTDLGQASWREPVEHYLSPERLAAEIAQSEEIRKLLQKT